MVNLLADWLTLATTDTSAHTSAPKHRSADQLMLARLQIKIQERFGVFSPRLLSALLVSVLPPLQ